MEDMGGPVIEATLSLRCDGAKAEWEKQPGH